MASKKEASGKQGVAVLAYDNSWAEVVAATADDVKTVELALGVKIPKELATLLRTCNAGRPAKPFYYDKQRQHELHLGWLIPLRDLAKRRGMVTVCQIQRQVHGMPPHLLPFAVDNGNSDLYCVNLSTQEVVYWVHDTVDADRAISCAAALSDVLAGLTDPPY